MSNYSYPQHGATYMPGQDDYYEPQTPNVASPAPQRMQAELPDQIHTSLSRLDLNASNGPPAASYHGPGSASSGHSPSLYSARSMDGPGSYPQNQTPQPVSNKYERNFPGVPKLPFRTPNIPESDEERGARLERDRLPILNSSNFEEQLGWAQDALNWVDGAAEQDRRLAHVGRGRSSVPPVEGQMRTDALNVVEHMASQNHPRAKFMRGMWLEFAKFGYAEDKRTAFDHFTVAARGGYTRAEYRIGMQFETSNMTKEALSHYAAGEAAGDSASCYRMGMIAALGQLGQRQDFARAVALIRHAAETADENSPQGAYVYGMLLANDLPQIHVPQQFLALDVDGARQNMERAAFLGFSKAQLKLGQAYEVASLHCEVNPVLSLHYNALAARQGEPEAEMALSKWFLVGANQVFGKDDKLAYMYAERATQGGLPTSLFAMGYFNEVGAGTTVNIDQARSWYERAASLGSQEAINALKRMDIQGPMNMGDHKKITMDRIRSTHGSKRGNRPPRLKQPPTNISSAPEQSRYAFGQGTAPTGYSRPPGIGTSPPGPGNAGQRPPRTTSAVPYPLDDHPAAAAAAFPSEAPRQSLTQPATRRSSEQPFRDRPGAVAVGIRRPVAPIDRPYAGSPVQGFPPKSFSSTDMTAGQRPIPQRLANGGSVGSALPVLSPKEPIQNYAAPNGVQSYPRPPPNNAAMSQRPSMDFRPPASSHQYPSSGTPKLQPFSNPGSRPPSRPSSAGGQRRHEPSSGSQASSTRPSGNAPGRPPPATTTTRPPGKGPQTFEQMNVPLAKNDSECSVM